MIAVNLSLKYLGVLLLVLIQTTHSLPIRETKTSKQLIRLKVSTSTNFTRMTFWIFITADSSFLQTLGEETSRALDTGKLREAFLLEELLENEILKATLLGKDGLLKRSATETIKTAEGILKRQKRAEDSSSSTSASSSSSSVSCPFVNFT